MENYEWTKGSWLETHGDDKYSVYNFSGAGAILEDFKQDLLTLDSVVTNVLLSLYIPVFVLSFFANGLLLYVLCSGKRMRRIQNYFMANLAFSDLGITLVCMPLTVGHVIYKSWVFGAMLCKLAPCLQGLCVSASILSLVVSSVDRYLAFRQSGSKTTVMTSRRVFFLVLSTWVVSFFFVAPLLYVRQLAVEDLPPKKITYCIERWPGTSHKAVYGSAIFVFVYILPCIALVVCYCFVGRMLWKANTFQRRQVRTTCSAVIKGRQLVAKMLITLAILFMVSWTPYNVLSLAIDTSQQHNVLLHEMLPFTLWFAHAHSAVNPVMYWCLNKSFRHQLRKLWNDCKYVC